MDKREKNKNKINQDTSKGADAKILLTALREYSKDGLTEVELQKLKELDNVLTDAGFILVEDGKGFVIDHNPDATVSPPRATIRDKNGLTFTILQ